MMTLRCRQILEKNVFFCVALGVRIYPEKAILLLVISFGDFYDKNRLVCTMQHFAGGTPH